MNIVFLCVKIFIARILDVSFGTIRTVLTIKEKKLAAAFIGFCEVLIWFVIVKEALNTDMDSVFIPISYALGYACGTYIGSALSEKLIKGNLGVQIITSHRDNHLIQEIRNHGFGVSVIDVNTHQKDTSKYMLFIEIDKKRLPKLKKLVKVLDPDSFIVVNETKYVQNGYFR